MNHYIFWTGISWNGLVTLHLPKQIIWGTRVSLNICFTQRGLHSCDLLTSCWSSPLVGMEPRTGTYGRRIKCDFYVYIKINLLRRIILKRQKLFNKTMNAGCEVFQRIVNIITFINRSGFRRRWPWREDILETHMVFVNFVR